VAGQDAPADLARPGRLSRDQAARARWLALSDERDRQLEYRQQAWRDGWRACGIAHADDYEQGYADGLARRKRREHETVAALQLYLRRWELRGERRTRRTFGDPNPDDFQGRGEAA
jgi:hypothetical protein